jgi:hypothetical protein
MKAAAWQSRQTASERHAALKRQDKPLALQQ